MARNTAGRTVSGPLVRRVAGPAALVLAVVSSIAVGASSAGADATPAPRSTSPGTASAPSTTSSPGPTGPATAGESPASTPTSTAASPTGSPTESSTATSTDQPSDQPSDGDGVPGVDSPGISMTITPQRSGDLDVQQTVWLNLPVTTLTLAPPDLSSAGAAFAGRNPTISDLKLSADGQDITLQSTEVGQPRVLSLLTAASRFTVSYTLRNAVTRSHPSIAGRALGAIRPMILAPEQQLPVMVEVLGRSVRAIVCPELGNNLVSNCAAPTNSGSRLSASIPSTASLLQLQLDLNRA